MPEKRTKLFLVITKSNMGGAQRYVFDLATNINKKKFDVTVILGGSGPLKTKLEDKRIRVKSLPSLERDISVFKDIKSLYVLYKIFKREKPDVIHLNSSKVGLFGSIAGRMARIKGIVFTAHGWVFNEDRHPIARFMIRIMQWLNLILSHKVIVVSEGTLKDVKDYMFVKGKFKVIHNGIGKFSSYSKREARDKLLDSNHKLHDIYSHVAFKDSLVWIGTTSELHKNKGLKYTIQAIANLKKTKKLPPFIFLIIGEGEERANLETLVAKNNLSSTVFFIGYLDSAYKYLSALDIFTLTSETEALPYSLLEAGMMKLPILATSVGGVPEIVEDMRTGIIVKKKKVEEIEHALKFLLTHEDDRKKFGHSISSHIEENFSQREMVERTERVYNDLI